MRQHTLLHFRQVKRQKICLVPPGGCALWVRLYLDEAREQLASNAQDCALLLGNEGLPLSRWLSTLLDQRVKDVGVGRRGC